MRTDSQKLSFDFHVGTLACMCLHSTTHFTQVHTINKNQGTGKRAQQLKSEYCSSRDPEFDFQYPHQLTTTCNSSIEHILQTHTHNHIIKFLKNLKNNQAMGPRIFGVTGTNRWGRQDRTRKGNGEWQIVIISKTYMYLNIINQLFCTLHVH